MENKNNKKNIVFYVITCVCVALVCVFFVNFVKAKKNNEPVYIFNKYAAMWVLTDSMEDTIPAKTFILIKKCDGSDCNIDDIITFKSIDPSIKGMLNTHRIIDKNDESKSFTTKGDHNMIQDNYPVPYENVCGKYVRNMAVLTFLGRAFFSNFSYILLIVIIVGAIGFYIFRIIKDASKKEDEKETNATTLTDEEKQKLIEEEIERLKKQEANHE